MNELILSRSAAVLGPEAALPLPVPWRDPHTVPKDVLKRHIQDLERACVENPTSADLFTCLGMAYAMDLRVYRSIDALETARTLNPTHFWAQFKCAELSYRLRALPLAEQETLRALALATTQLEYAVSRKQLQEIRRLIREGTQKPAWTKPLLTPAVVTFGIAFLLCVGVAWK